MQQADSQVFGVIIILLQTCCESTGWMHQESQDSKNKIIKSVALWLSYCKQVVHWEWEDDRKLIIKSVAL